MPACPTCGEDNPERARFCWSCGAAIAEAPRSGAEERKIVSVLFVDLVGFTPGADFDATRAKVDGLDGRKLWVSCACTAPDGTLTFRGGGLFLVVDVSHFDLVITSKYPAWLVRHHLRPMHLGMLDRVTRRGGLGHFGALDVGIVIMAALLALTLGAATLRRRTE